METERDRERDRERDIERGRDRERDRERDGRMARYTSRMPVQGIRSAQTNARQASANTNALSVFKYNVIPVPLLCTANPSAM